MQKEKATLDHSYKICPSCSFFCSTKEVDKYCSFCGSELIDKCPECGEVILNAYAKFCKFCGTNYPSRNEDELKESQ
ncbi:MAG: hypothetical protein C4543_04360 [Ignavibacteriales bacterium]|nr:MAG: hypothetical protein C4543_04360 [Ignavibacteriales bacterium]